jgi:ABC-type uncharacterized transport system permease subunit
VNAVVFDIALTAYIIGAVSAVASLFGQREPLLRFTSLVTQLGWVCHTVALVMRGMAMGRAPVLTLAEAVSAVIWAVVLADLWIGRRFRMPVLSAFVLPVVLALGLALPTGLRALALEPPPGSGWVVVHVALVLIGLAALVLNFVGALMYLLQERQLKSRRFGAVYHWLPPLETLDRLTFVPLTIGFPFLTVGLALGVVSAGQAWGSPVAFDPLAFISALMWLLYAATLAFRVVGHWRGRRAAYFAIAGFCALLLTLGAGVLFQGRHGS